MTNTQPVITVRNVYTRQTHTVCWLHDSDDLGDTQVQHAWHDGECDLCDKTGGDDD